MNHLSAVWLEEDPLHKSAETMVKVKKGFLWTSALLWASLRLEAPASFIWFIPLFHAHRSDLDCLSVTLGYLFDHLYRSRSVYYIMRFWTKNLKAEWSMKCGVVDLAISSVVAWPAHINSRCTLCLFTDLKSFTISVTMNCIKVLLALDLLEQTGFPDVSKALTDLFSQHRDNIPPCVNQLICQSEVSLGRQHAERSASVPWRSGLSPEARAAARFWTFLSLVISSTDVSDSSLLSNFPMSTSTNQHRALDKTLQAEPCV